MWDANSAVNSATMAIGNGGPSAPSLRATTQMKPKIVARVRNSDDVGPRFQRMSVRHFTACRPGISGHVGPPFHGMSVQFVR